ncbi:homocysteine S-methyltransferase family protein [bacterium]|nr:homocysteine S-methyltransferase family protein [bacterium]
MNLMERIKSQGLLFDGAIGSELQRKGLPPGQPPDIWNIKNPDAVRELHVVYVEAGSDVITTNTFNSNPVRFGEYKSGRSWEELTRAGVRLAKEVAANKALVAGEIGPSGLLLEPVGPGKPDEIERAFSAQAKILDEEGVDFFIAETFFDLKEILLVASAFRSISQKPFILSMTFEKRKKGYFSLFGNRVNDAMKAMADSGAIAVGANCSLGSADMIAVAKEAREAVPVPVIMQANAGMPQVTPQGTVYPENNEMYVANIMKISELGVDIIGGCCGTTPETIALIRKRWK